MQNIVRLACLEVALPKIGILGILVCKLQTEPVMSNLFLIFCSLIDTSGKNFMVIPFAVPEILGGVETGILKTVPKNKQSLRYKSANFRIDF